MRRFTFLFLMVLIFGCNQAPKIPDDFDYGKTENGIYKNEFFDMEVDIPDAFRFQTREQMEEVLNQGQKNLEKSNKELASKMKVNRVSTAMLLMLVKKKPDPGMNFSFMIMAENINTLLSIKTSLDYLDRLKKSNEQVGILCQPDYTVREIGGRAFDVLKAVNTTGGRDIKLAYHVRVIKGFVLVIISAFDTEKQEQESFEVLQNIKFH